GHRASARSGPGSGAERRTPDGARRGPAVVLVCLVSAQVRLPAAPGTLIGVLVALILTSALPGMLLAARLTPSARTSVVLNVWMREFAVAGGIAAAPSCPAAAAPRQLPCPRHGLGRSGRPPG
ncbi:MAG TPA: hypothetical protein VF940_11030, partial [Streptosporangiaceae bacterium]